MTTTKTLHIIRHGESEQNKLMHDIAIKAGFDGMTDGMKNMNDSMRAKLFECTFCDKEIDYKLTPKGREQAKFLQTDAALREKITLVVSSSQERALRTAALGLGDLVGPQKQCRAVVLDNAREFITADPGERRTAVSKRLLDPALKAWDFSNCTNDDELWEGMKRTDSFEFRRNDFSKPPWECPSLAEAVGRRGEELLEYIFQQPDEHVALVTHWGFAFMGIIVKGFNVRESGEEFLPKDFGNGDRITLEITKPAAPAAYKMRFVEQRRCRNQAAISSEGNRIGRGRL